MRNQWKLLPLISLGVVLLACRPVISPPFRPPEQTLPIAITGDRFSSSDTPLVIDLTQPSQIQPGFSQDATPTIIIPTQERIIFETPPESSGEGGPPPDVHIDLPSAPAAQPRFDAFVESVKNGVSSQIVGVYVDGVLALRVVQQPPNDPGYVSIRDGEATQFRLAATIANNIGLLAHNYLAGKQYFNIREGDLIQVVYGDGRVEEFEVTRILQYQALSPDSPTSDFVDLQNGATLSATNLFYEVYGGAYHLTLQTCIARDNDSEWGRLFIIAEPY
ncbi:MAG: hypothetical protein HPY45_06975 [Anaerolineae bacterium]|nr:hypothetical protein [Anaerolineae bacterium]